MRNSVFMAGVIAASFISGKAIAQGRTDTPQVVVTGEGEVHVSPDRATISLGVQTRAPTAAAAGAENARRQRAVIDALKALGLQSDQISTAEYNVYPEMAPMTQPGGQPRVVAYNVSNTVRVEVRRIEDVGRIIDAALAKGANEMSGLQFSFSKPDSARRVALAAAVEDARRDAEVLAKAAGGSLGMLLEVSTATSPVRPVSPIAFRAVAAEKMTPIEPGQQTISATVTARWTLLSGK